MIESTQVVNSAQVRADTSQAKARGGKAPLKSLREEVLVGRALAEVVSADANLAGRLNLYTKVRYICD